MRYTNTQRGVTLIETMVYIALFSIIIGGSVVAAYQVLESSGRSQTRAMLQEEGDFLIGKINWALSGVQSGTPTGQNCTESNTLSVSKWDTSIGVIVMNETSGNMNITYGGNPPVALNNSNVSVSALSFTHCFLNTSNPESMGARFTLSANTPNGANIAQDFFATSTLRK